jgi:tRNA (cytidine32/uridine32-2'-O)-methyltransferase
MRSDKTPDRIANVLLKSRPFLHRAAKLLTNFKVVLVETSHPGNIGAVARAMKNMGMDQLRLVNPKFFPHADATARASGADDVLRDAQVFVDIGEAVADCQVVLGASARDRTISWPTITARELARQWPPSVGDVNVALVFGRENSGLKNHELDLCHQLLRIPCNPDYSSLNLASAVQVVCYELFLASEQPATPVVGDADQRILASAAQMDAFYLHFEQALADIGFLHPARSRSLMRRLRRLFNRAQMDIKELDIMRGILRFAQNHNLK